ncbi:NADPH-dependent FMN reductase [Acinetobacter pittii]|uniref:NADPH-dependent FMN reductase n=1 Tax=Acinetobacter pittii TaxID=48296 RepID=UPI00355BB526
MKDIVGLVGNFNIQSRTYQLVDEITQEAAQKFNLTSSIYNLTSLGHSFLIAQSPNDLDLKAKTIIQHIIDSDILIIGVPTWNAGYPGMFKHLFDLIAPDAY